MVPESPTYEDILASKQPHPIHSEADADRVRAEVQSLVRTYPRTAGQKEYLSLLSQLLIAWESETVSPPSIPGVEVLRSLLEDNELTQSALVGPVFASAGISRRSSRGSAGSRSGISGSSPRSFIPRLRSFSAERRVGPGKPTGYSKHRDRMLEQENTDLHGRELGQKLYAEARDFLAGGGARAEAINALSEVYDHLGNEDDRDAVADVIDAVEGFCSPTAAL
jgi:antitoxin component HigA of HigAB toxin-antitoxin module